MKEMQMKYGAEEENGDDKGCVAGSGKPGGYGQGTKSTMQAWPSCGDPSNFDENTGKKRPLAKKTEEFQIKTAETLRKEGFIMWQPAEPEASESKLEQSPMSKNSRDDT